MLRRKIKKILGLADQEKSKKINVKVAENVKTVDRLLFGDEWLNICRETKAGKRICYPNDDDE